MAKEIFVEVVAPDRVWWSGKATMVSAQTVEGSLGFLAGHEPVLSVLATGPVRIHSIEGDIVALTVTGGFVSFDHDTVRVVADGVSEGVEAAKH